MYKIEFKKLEENDMPLMYKWLTTDFVHQWYCKNKNWTQDTINEKYLPQVRGETPISSYTIICNNDKIGYIQTYKTADYPEYNECLNTGYKTAGIDLFIGKKDYLHKGLGKLILKQFLKDYVFKLYDISHCTIGPEPDNKSAIAAYKKAGFKYLKTVTIPKKNEEECILIISKEDAYI